MNNRLLRPPLLEWAILPPRPYGLYDAGNAASLSRRLLASSSVRPCSWRAKT